MRLEARDRRHGRPAAALPACVSKGESARAALAVPGSGMGSAGVRRLTVRRRCGAIGDDGWRTTSPVVSSLTDGRRCGNPCSSCASVPPRRCRNEQRLVHLAKGAPVVPGVVRHVETGGWACGWAFLPGGPVLAPLPPGRPSRRPLEVAGLGPVGPCDSEALALNLLSGGRRRSVCAVLACHRGPPTERLSRRL